MTLIVGKLIGDEVYLEADSRISDPRVARLDPLCGQLKCVIVNPFLCVCFAGNVHYAELALRCLLDQENISPEGARQLLAAAHTESSESTDFAMVYLRDGHPHAFKIAQGSSQSTSAFWLGDQAAYVRFEQEFHSFSDGDMNSRMRRAFRAVIEDDSIDSVGDFHVRTAIDRKICPGVNVFLHGMETAIEVSHPQQVHAQNGQWTFIPLGTAEGGAFGISYMRTVSPRFNGIAVHFPHGRFGVLFCPKLSLSGIVFDDIDGCEFAHRILTQYGVPLQGLVRSSETELQFVDTRGLERLVTSG
jgi:hypothetical protein